jgi:membrane protease YdiL (CAAX protease family)
MTSPLVTEPHPPPPAPRRIPNLLHLLLFLGITLFTMIAAEGIVALTHRHDIMAALVDQRLQLVANIACYFVALGLAAIIFPLLWRRSFLEGIRWRSAGAVWQLIPLGLGLGVLTQAVSTLLPIPKKLPIEKIFVTPGIIWVLALFGTFVAPLFEEIVFRGFLLPGIALAVDYLRLPKSLDALADWRSSTTFSRLATIVSSIVTSICFAGIHAPQLGFAWAAVLLLIGVSLILCAIRLRTGSVAASTLVHTCYNFSVFLSLFVATGGFRHMEKL